MKMLWTGLVACALLLSPAAAMADSGTQASKVRASLVVTGSIVIKPDGSVASYVLDKQDQLPAGALQLIAKAVPRWRFRPVMREGKAVTATSHMSMRLVGRSIGDGKFAVGISGAHFGNAPAITYARRTKPVYPRRLIRQHVAGTVYLLLQVARDGTVQHVAAQQVNLYVKGAGPQMKWWRKTLAEASIDAARHWTFNVPTEDAAAQKRHWDVRVPVTFRVKNHGRATPAYEGWQVYMPGPRQFIPWLDRQMLATGSADAMPANGGLSSMQQSLHLLTPLGGDGSS